MTTTTTSDVPSKSPQSAQSTVIMLPRRTIDSVLVGLGILAIVILVVAGGLLAWGHQFASNYVDDELSSQNISFPSNAALIAEGRSDLTPFGGRQVNTGKEAEAYASYINGHLIGIANGATYADLGAAERAAKAAAQKAVDDGADQQVIDELQTTKAGITAQRDSLFKGETLRGLLLSAFAWSTVGTIAGIAAIAAFIAAIIMTFLVGIGLVHRARTRRIISVEALMT